MCERDGSWELRGVLSYHRNCGRGLRPSIFSDVSSVKKWIQQTTRMDFDSIESDGVLR